MAVVVLMLALLIGSAAADPASFSVDVTVRYAPGHPLNRFRPVHALGAGIDGGPAGETALLTPANVATMDSTGFKSLTLRLRTELGIDAWHWNPAGTWSDPQRTQGYWTSDASSQTPIVTSYGYSLPRRGNTTDQANDVGYSRIDDGDVATFWKSNPYLDQHFTHEPNARHEQWIVVDLGEPKPINALRIAWGFPFASDYDVQYAVTIKDPSAIALNRLGLWQKFPRGSISHAHGGDEMHTLASRVVLARFVRILLKQYSNVGAPAATDVRDALGFAVRELQVGVTDGAGAFHDAIVHAPSHDQTRISVSSTDPWHRAMDLDRGIEQPGFDRVIATGLAHDQPLLIATGLLFDTPENAASEIRYLQSHRVRLERVELGEEPDGQYVSPEDYGALYLQFADAIHAVDPALRLGGPSFQEILADKGPLAERLGNSAWFKRFLAYLRARRREADYAFFSFEWYPVDDVCAPPALKLIEAHRLLGDALAEMRRRGLDRRRPWIISEYGYSAFAARAELDLEGALLDADLIGQFLSLGGDQAFLYGYTPGAPQRDRPCTSGNNLLFAADERGAITHQFARYHAARMLTQLWAQPANRYQELFAADLRTAEPTDASAVNAYPLRHPDGSWSLLLINRDPTRAAQVRIHFAKAGMNGSRPFMGPIDVAQFSRTQYALNPASDAPYPVRSYPPARVTLQQPDAIMLPPYSLTVVSGKSVY